MSIFVTNHTMLTFGSETKMSNQEKIEEYHSDIEDTDDFGSDLDEE